MKRVLIFLSLAVLSVAFWGIGISGLAQAQEVPTHNLSRNTGKVYVYKMAPDGSPQAGVNFKLYKGQTKVAEGATNINGGVTFDNLEPGSDYYLKEDVPAGYTSDLDENTPFEVKSGETTGFEVTNTPVPPERTSKGKVHVYKMTADGEPQAGVTFRLYKGQTKVAEGTTDATGDLVFDNLEPGNDYRLDEDVPSGYTSDLDENTPINVNANETTGIEVTNTPEPDEPGGRVIIHKTTPDGAPQAGVTFKLYKGQAKIADGTTDANGSLVFDNLKPDGDYYIEEDVPAGYTSDLDETPFYVDGNGEQEPTRIDVVNTPEPRESEPPETEDNPEPEGSPEPEGVSKEPTTNELPFTGGSPLPYYSLGLLLTVLGLRLRRR